MSPLSEARKRANNKYDSKAYDKLLTRLPKGKKEIIAEYAQSRNESLNGFINRAIDETMQRDTAKPDGE